MAKCKGQMLDVDLRKGWVILRNKEVSWQNTTLSCRCRSEEEIKLLAFGTLVLDKTFIDDTATRRIWETTLRISHKEALRYSFVDHNHSDLWFFSCLVVQLDDGFFELRNLSRKNLVALSITDTVSVDHEVSRELVVVVLREWLDRLLYRLHHVFLHYLLTFFLNKIVTIVLTHVFVNTCRETDNWLRSCVTNVNADQHGSLLG
jgi:hypothetical protein